MGNQSGSDEEDDEREMTPPPRRAKKPKKSRGRSGGKFENFRVTIHNESDGTPSLSEEGSDGGESDLTRESPVEKSRRSTPPPPLKRQEPPGKGRKRKAVEPPKSPVPSAKSKKIAAGT